MLKRSIKRQKLDQNQSSARSSVKSDASFGKKVLGSKSDDEEDDKILEKIVIGDDDILDQLKEHSKKQKTKKHDDPEATDTPVPKPAPVWEDEDDLDIKVKISRKDYKHKYFKHQEKKEITGEEYTHTLKTQFEKVIGQPSWAKLKWQKSEDEGSSDDPDAEDLLQKTGHYLGSSESLPAGIVQMKLCTDANKQGPARVPLTAMEFHPSAQVMLTGSMNQKLSLFQIDGKNNPKIQSIFLDKFPILSAHFTREGSEVILASRHKGFKYYDMIGGQVIDVPKMKGTEENRFSRFETSPDGKYIVFLGEYGHMHFISAKSKEWLYTLKMNGSVEAVAFAPDGSKMFSHGSDGEVYVWDLATRDCIHKFMDDGCTQGTALSVSHNAQYIAAGSYSGVVNIYDQSCLSAKVPKPLKTVMNLTTPCSRLVFNSTTEILAVASHHAEKAVRLIHMASLSAFSNFPERDERLGKPHLIDFSLNSGYFAVGNNKGKALLYRVKHYSNY